MYANTTKTLLVVPANAGTQGTKLRGIGPWASAFAGVTGKVANHFFSTFHRKTTGAMMIPSSFLR
jgi:hypothetical protein